MLPIEPLFCPCCTPALLHTLAHTNLTRIPQQMLWLGTGAMAAAIKRQQQPSRSQVPSRKSISPTQEQPQDWAKLQPNNRPRLQGSNWLPEYKS